MGIWFGLLITTTALLTSSIPVHSQDGSGTVPQIPFSTTTQSPASTTYSTERYGDLVSRYKPVLIYPPDATCTQGNITLAASESQIYVGTDITYQCVPTCSRTYPVQHDTLFQAVAEDEVIYLGGPNCRPNEEDLRNTLFRRRRREDNDVTNDCYTLIDTRPAGLVHTYMMDVYAQSNGVIFNVEGLFWLRVDNGQSLNIETDATQSGTSFRMNKWTRIALQVKRNELEADVEMTMYIGSVRLSRLHALNPADISEENSHLVYLGLGELASDPGKNFLQVSRCRTALGRATTELLPSEQASVFVSVYTDLTDQIQAVCGNRVEDAHVLLCALLFPDPAQQPCKAACDEIDVACDGLFSNNSLVCTDESSGCYNPDPEGASDPVFQGKVRNVKIYSEILTDREILAALNEGGLPSLSPKSECLCPESSPRSTDGDLDLDLYCSSTLGSDAFATSPRHVHADTDRLFLPDYLTDGISKNYDRNQYVKYDGIYLHPNGFRMWATTPGTSTFTLTMLLQQTTVVSRVALYSLLLHTGSVYTLQSYEENRWKDLQYFTAIDNQCPSQNLCTIVQSPPIEWDVPDFNIDTPFSSVMTEKLRFQVSGDLASEQDFYIVTEFMVFGKEFCNCYGPGTVPGTDCDSERRCVCIGELDMSLASPQCEPYIHTAVPLYGPDSGGTYLSLHGELLMSAEAPPRVFLENHGECSSGDHGSYSNDTVIRCRTPERTTDDLDSVITVNIGDLNITTGFTFSYRPDPVITGIEPRSTILSGGIVQTVTGMNLDSVYAPMMTTFVRYKTLDPPRLEILTSPCTVVNSTVMLCPVPIIPYEETYRDIWSNPSNVGAPVSDTRIDVTVGFSLDGVPDFALGFAPLTVYYDPKIDTWLPDRVRLFRTYPPHNQRQLEITGERLWVCCVDSDFLITVGGETCEISLRDATTIYCFPPLEEPENNDNLYNTPAVKAFVGTIEQTVGYLDYESNVVQSDQFKIGLAVSLVLLLALGLIIFLAYRYVLHLRKKRLDFERRESFEHLNQLKRKDTMLLTLLPDKLQNRLEGCLIDIDQLETTTELGKGNFGVVYKGVLKRDEEVTDVAVKTIKKLDIGFSDIEEFLQEATITRGFDHPNVLTIIGVSIDRRECFVVLPFMEKGNLRDLLLDTSNRFNVGELVRLGLQAAKGMEYLESQNFLHRDVAARNCICSWSIACRRCSNHIFILYREHLASMKWAITAARRYEKQVGADGVVKIADFGLSRDLYGGNYYQSTTSRPLPVKWMAIECLVNNAVFTTKSDVWSFGVLLWEIITRGVVPYSYIDPRHQLHHLKQGGRLGKPEHCPDALYKLMLGCWAVKPKDRPSFKEIVDYINNLVDSGDESGDENTTERSRPSRGETSCPPAVQDTAQGTAANAAPSRSDSTRAEASANIASLRRDQRGGTAVDETSFSKPYERLSQVPGAANTDDKEHSKDADYTRLSTVPPYLELVETPPETQREVDYDEVVATFTDAPETSEAKEDNSDSTKLLKNENPEELQEVVSDGEGGVVNPSHVAEEEPRDNASDAPEYLAIVESPMSNGGYVNIADAPLVEEAPKKRSFFSRNRKEKDTVLYMNARKSYC